MRFRFALSCATLVSLSSFGSIAWAQPGADAGAPVDPTQPGAAPPSGEPAPPGAAPAEPAPPAPPPAAPPPAPTPPAEAPPASAPPENPPVTAAPTTTPPIQPVMPAVAPAPGVGDRGATDAAAKEERPPEMTLALELDGGLHSRLGDASDYGFGERESGGITFGPSVWFSGSRLWSVGLVYQHTRLGTDRSDPAQGTLSVKRSLNALWLSGRAYPWRTDQMGLFVALSLGMSWQNANASGARETQSFVKPAESFSCSASEGPGFALGGGVGFDLELEKNLAFITQVDASGHRHTSDTLDGCAPGSGSVTGVAGRIGFAYRFDMDEGSSRSSARSGRTRTH